MHPSRAVVALALSLLAVVPSPGGAAAEHDLHPRFRLWLEEVEPLMSREERRAFLALDKDYQRDAFIAAFWAARDPVPATPENEFQGRYESLLAEARERFREPGDDRTRVFVLNGPPAEVQATDCGVLTWPLELWRYAYSAHLGRGFEALFYQPSGGGPFRLWHPAEGHKVLLPTLADPEDERAFEGVLNRHCGEMQDDISRLLTSIDAIEADGGTSSAQAAAPPELEDPEWLLAFRAVSTDRPAAAPELPASMVLGFPSRLRQRTVVEGLLEVPAAAAGTIELDGRTSYGFELNGEVLVGSELFDSFRYRFDVPAARLAGERIPLLFERYLRPGDYTLIVKLEDLGGGGVFREERAVAVPRVEAEAVAGLSDEVDAAVAAATAAPAGGGATSIRLTGGAAGPQRGLARFDATAEGEGIARVAFLLDGKPLLTKTQPPYSVELDLGQLPRRRSVRVVALAADGRELATDEIVVNPGEHAFRVRIVEPRAGAAAPGRVRLRAEVEVPPGERVERLEVWRGEELVATLYQEPWIQPVDLDGGGGTIFLRAVAHLDDGNSTEDLVLLGGAGFGEAVDVRLVELFATVLGDDGRPVHDLAAADFKVFESGAEQGLLRFDRLEDLPLYAALLIDTSASMAEHLPTVRRIAQQFFAETIRPQDRAAVVTFSDRPRLVTDFTGDQERLAAALAGVHPEQGTALWDSVVFTLYTVRDIKGQRALVLLSDGEDRRSEYTFDEALRYATAAGVTIYPVALARGLERGARRQLERLAEATGGRAFVLADIAELAAAYDTIEEDLRSRYLLVYQAPGGGGDAFRPIEVRVARSGHQVRTLQGYYP